MMSLAMSLKSVMSSPSPKRPRRSVPSRPEEDADFYAALSITHETPDGLTGDRGQVFRDARP
jgi:hypothetical protein